MSLRALLWKDLRIELRGKEGLQAGLVLVALFFLVELFAFQDLQHAPRTAAAVLWIPLAFAAAAAFGRGMAAEHDRGTLERLRQAAVHPGLHGASRTVVNLLLALLLTLLTAALGAGLFLIPVTPSLLGVLLLGALGLTIAGTLAGALAAQTRAREVLLPILLIPVVAPLLQAGIGATLDLLGGGTAVAATYFLLGYDLLAAGLAWFLWPLVLEADA